MKKLTNTLGLNSDEELFKHFINTLKLKGITQWDYYVNWEKVFNNLKPYEVELNILNVLVGKENIKEHLVDIINKYPRVINCIPVFLLF